MAQHYVGLDVGIHCADFVDWIGVEQVRRRVILALVKEFEKEIQFDSDIEVEIVEVSGAIVRKSEPE